jgi:hypothetical protein
VWNTVISAYEISHAKCKNGENFGRVYSVQILSNKKPSGESALRAAKRADGTDKFLGNKKELFQEIEKQLLNVID